MDLETAFEDYTDMVEGSTTPDGGMIARCPRCDQVGRFSELDGNQTYEHRRVGPDETRETCIIPKPKS